MSRERLTPSSFAILGLLAGGAGSGYQLGTRARLVSHFWPLTRPYIYSELAKLEQRGLVTSTDIEQHGLPDKRVYAITDDGVGELDAWLNDPDPGVQRPRHPLLIKVLLGERVEPSRMRELLKRYRADVEARRSGYSAVLADHYERSSCLGFAQMTALFGLRRMEADLAWLDEVEAQFRDGAG